MKKILERLSNGEMLDKEEARQVMTDIGTGGHDDLQIAAFLMAYLMRPVTPQELAGFREALLALAVPVDLNGLHTLDVCGTGGDGKNTFNISTLTAFVCAGAGARVVKHGNTAATSAAGSSDVMQHLGYHFSTDTGKLRRELEEAGLSYLHAPFFHPALKHVAPVRRTLGVRTFFNILGPMVNPARPKSQLIGVFSRDVQDLYSGVYAGTDTAYAIVHSHDGYDEISLTAPARLLTPAGEETLTPEHLSLPRNRPAEIAGGNNVKENTEIFLKVLRNEGTPAQTHAVLANSTVALQCYFTGWSREEAYLTAERSLTEGKAYKVFKTLINMQS
jgi:anthranilate phosphoribosyltransferase